jgi:PPOX class probable F420-dependent enzyme
VADDEQAYVENRLRDAVVIWLTTVRSDGQPQTSPVWFFWDGERFLIYSRPTSQKVPNVRGNPCVSLNLDGDRDGGEILTIEGSAEIDEQAPLANEVEAYVEKYREHIKRLGTEPEPFARMYSTPIRITPTRRRVYR